MPFITLRRVCLISPLLFVAITTWYGERSREPSPLAEPGSISERLPDKPQPLASQRIVDPSVQPVGLVENGLLVSLAAVGQNPQASIRIGYIDNKVDERTFRWEAEALAPGLVRLVGNAGSKVTMRLVEPPAEVQVELNDTKVDKETQTSGSAGETTVDFTLLPLKPGMNKLAIGIEPMQAGDLFTPSMTLDLVVPSADDAMLQMPEIIAVSNNRYGPLLPWTTSNTIKLYDNYLRLSGQRGTSGTRYQFTVFQTATSDQGPVEKFVRYVDPQSPVTVGTAGRWDASLDLNLPQSLNASSESKGIILPIATQDGGRHAFADAKRFGVPFIVAQFSEVNYPVASITSIQEKPLEAPVVFGTRKLRLTGTINQQGSSISTVDSQAVIFLADRESPLTTSRSDQAKGDWTAEVEFPFDGTYELQVASAVGPGHFGTKSDPFKVTVDTVNPRVVDAVPVDGTLTQIKVTFSEPVQFKSGAVVDSFALLKQGDVSSGSRPTDSTYMPIGPVTSLTLTFDDIAPELYTFQVRAGNIMDVAGNPLAEEFSKQLFRPIGAESPIASRGIRGPTGNFVPYGEYTEPREVINGFNPSDHVETRVSRLYFYRNAHRVAQIINRKSASHNVAAVQMQEQLADKARQIADQATDKRQEEERRAVEAAKLSREAENQLQQAEQVAQSAAMQAAQANTELDRTADPDDRSRMANVVNQMERVASAARSRADALTSKVEQLRKAESQARETWQQSIAVENRSREEQFRREVAAAHADPDTYAEGKPDSKDPVEQVSISVIGEGLIQMRGPLKGINIIRTQINQIDSPVGQVRVGVHTVQINGERGDRMEVVGGKIQRYIDHARFLTTQSGEMLRKAIVQVAARRAYEHHPAVGQSQQERDRRYLYAFFGREFIHELEEMDSEFLHTGNKLLSLHSMDSTSLASALFVMALANNSTRMEILQVFDEMMLSALPYAESQYFEAGITCDGKHRLFDKHCKPSDFQMLSSNARFQSIRGFFDAEVLGDDTITPVQREFVRLAQIFKSQLVVEMELKQRIMERAVIEERLGDRQKMLQDSRAEEKRAKEALNAAQNAWKDAQRTVLEAAQNIQGRVRNVQGEVVKLQRAHEVARQLAYNFNQPLFWNQNLDRNTAAAVLGPFLEEGETIEELWGNPRGDFEQKILAARRRAEKKMNAPLAIGESLAERYYNAQKDLYYESAEALRIHSDTLKQFPFPEELVLYWGDAHPEEMMRIVVTDMGLQANLSEKAKDAFHQNSQAMENLIYRQQDLLSMFRYYENQQRIRKRADEMVKRGRAAQNLEDQHKLYSDAITLYQTLLEQVNSEIRDVSQQLDVAARLISNDGGIEKAEAAAMGAINKIRIALNPTAPTFDEYNQLVIGMENAFGKLRRANLDHQFAERDFASARQPLDHKKFLDMLVDEMEDKYIELLEGTRAHTANVDAYVKRLVTALDDDFNTQFYFPTFRKVREASQFYDVQLGQVETTNVLTNNRSFAKVSPQATMEFDLPQRGIVVAEALNGAKATIDDLGALTQDPTFLALAQLKSGQSTASPAPGSTMGMSTVRNVLPGLETSTAESVLAQHGPGGARLGAALESLIPDPAIYKFETGTGFEIRPVIQPDGQSVVFDFNYMYTTNIREPVRADEKHLGRVKRHFVDTNVQLGNYELREVSRYTVALKASRTSRGVPLLEDIPAVGVLFRPLPSDESSLQQNVILAQATIFPTLFDLMGLRWAPVVADLDPLRLSNDEFVVRSRRRALMNRVFDHSSSEVDKFLRIPEGERRMDLYRSQETIPSTHPNGYHGPGADLQDSHLKEGYDPRQLHPESTFVPGSSHNPHQRDELWKGPRDDFGPYFPAPSEDGEFEKNSSPGYEQRQGNERSGEEPIPRPIELRLKAAPLQKLEEPPGDVNLSQPIRPASYEMEIPQRRGGYDSRPPHDSGLVRLPPP